MAERSNAVVLKTTMGSSSSWVQIPLTPKGRGKGGGRGKGRGGGGVQGQGGVSSDGRAFHLH